MDGSLALAGLSGVAGGWSTSGRYDRQAVRAFSAAEFRTAMRQVPGAVCVIATEHAGRRAGFTATAVCSVSAEPPMLLVCINKTTSAHGSIIGAGCFSVNLLSTQHIAISDVFSGQSPLTGADRFDPSQWTMLATGAPILEEAVASFDCSIDRTIDAGTHTVVFGLVVASQVQPTENPLTYLRGRYVTAKL